MKGDAQDPKGLIQEAYRIEGIAPDECRSIFLDWALSVPVDADTETLLKTLVKRYGSEYPEHPMTQVLTEGLSQVSKPRRRGGWRSRSRD